MNIIDWTSKSYLNPPWAGHNRFESSITKIVVHHDAVIRPDVYDDYTRYSNEAAQHYNTLGPGLQYHYKINNLGEIYRIRPHTVWLHHAGDATANLEGIAICLDGYFHQPYNQQPTPQQKEALQWLLNWLCTQNPQFPADQNDVFPHRSFSATACCGDILVPYVDRYRTTGNVEPTAPPVAKPTIHKYSSPRYLWLKVDTAVVNPVNEPNFRYPYPKNTKLLFGGYYDYNGTRWNIEQIVLDTDSYNNYRAVRSDQTTHINPNPPTPTTNPTPTPTPTPTPIPTPTPADSFTVEQVSFFTKLFEFLKQFFIGGN